MMREVILTSAVAMIAVKTGVLQEKTAFMNSTITWRLLGRATVLCKDLRTCALWH
jgi:hypothetical protein